MEPRWHQLLAHATSRRSAGDPLDALMALLAALEVLTRTSDVVAHSEAVEFAEIFAETLAAARLDCGGAVFDALCAKHEELATVLGIAGSSLTPLASGSAADAVPGLLRTLDDLDDATFNACCSLPLPLAQRLALAWLSTRAVLTPGGEARRQMAASLVHQGLALPQTRALRHLAAAAWRLCSYSSANDKHAIKSPLGRWLASVVREVPAGFEQRGSMGNGPHIGVVLEVFSTDHAMYRCYAPALQQLAARARVTAILLERRLSRPFEFTGVDTLEFERTTPVEAIASAIAGRRFDVLFYPSVGLRESGITLANLRLAPTQVFAAGHPAPTGSAEMDFAFLSSDMAAAWTTFSERVVIRHRPLVHAPHAGLPLRPPITTQRNEGTFHLAIPAITLKLSSPFLSRLEEIAARAERPVHVHFFPNEAPTFAAALHRRLARRFPLSTVHPRYAYADLLEAMARCELALSPFPFGNSNGMVDCAVIALPCVAMRGTEAHGLTDARILRSLELEHPLVAESEEDYVERAVALMGSLDARAGLASRLGLEAVRSRLFATPPNVQSGTPDFAETLLWLSTLAPDHRVRGEPLAPPLSG